MKIDSGIDHFQEAIRRQPYAPALPKAHKERAHSKFSASGAERWFACPGSVKLSEGLPDRSSQYAEEGTRAHEVLESMLRMRLKDNTQKSNYYISKFPRQREMANHAYRTSDFIMELGHTADLVLVETRVYLDFLHPEAFGTFDGGAIEYFGNLDVVDYKYGKGVTVSPRGNLQMLFYALGLAHQYDWNFERIRLWIDQPRVKGYNGPVFWELTMGNLQGWIPRFEQAIERVEKKPNEYVEGDHCHWCRAKGVCPLKREAKAKNVFGAVDITGEGELIFEDELSFD